MEEYKYTCEPGHMEWTPLNSNLTMQSIKVIIIITRSCAALRAADLDWIVGPGCSSGRYILENNHEKP